MDRNQEAAFAQLLVYGSLSARRAWIEIKTATVSWEDTAKSLSARRAWIEIYNYFLLFYCFFGRSPQGERG